MVYALPVTTIPSWAGSAPAITGMRQLLTEPKAQRIMKLSSLIVFEAAVMGCLLIGINPAHAQGTAFTYQGQLNSNGTNVTGLYDIKFTLYPTNATGTAVTPPVTNTATAVTNGLFTVIVDFGNVDYGTNLWLELDVRTNSAANFSAPLAPRQQLTPVPSAISAESLSGNVSGAQIFGQLPSSALGGTYDGPVTLDNTGNIFYGNGSGLTGLNATNLTGTVPDGSLPANVALLNAGNTYTGLNVYNNLIKVVGPVSNNGYFGFLEEDNSGTGDFWILTKWDNVGNKRFSVYDGNGVTPIVLQESGGNVGIGTNSPNTRLQVVGTVSATAFSGSGSSLTGLTATNLTGTVPDGSLSANVALLNAGNTYTGLNVYNNLIKVVGPVSNNGYFGFLEEDSSDTGDFWILTKWDNVGNKRFSVYDGDGVTPIVLQESGGNVGIGTNSPNTRLQVVGTVSATAFSGSGSGLTGLTATNLTGTVPAAALGEAWLVNGNAGANPTNGSFLGTTDNLPLELHVNGQRAFRVEPTTDAPNVIGGYSGNAVSSGVYGAVIAGGGRSGNPQTAGGNYSAILGGIGNVASGTYSTAIGVTSMATNYGAVAMGDTAISGGTDSTAMGSHTIASGAASVAMGYYANATNDGSFVYADITSSSGFGSTAANQFLIRAAGGVGINTNNPGGTTLMVNGSAQVTGPMAAGYLRSPGAGILTGTFAFTQRAVGTNTSANVTTIYNPITDGDSSAILIITHNWTADTNSVSKYNTTPVGVYYTGAHWAIFNEDSSTMALGRAFNVMVIKP
jgi:hypothetical protein